MESDIIPQVSWLKDNLPLTSPDYETHFDQGLATLTIEETFSEDTARYTCRFSNDAGMVESSAYLNVRGQCCSSRLSMSDRQTDTTVLNPIRFPKVRVVRFTSIL